MLASAILEELNDIGEGDDAGELTFIPSCAEMDGSGGGGKENQ